jgi:rubrerythrin
MMTLLKKVLEQEERPLGVLSLAFGSFGEAAGRQQRPNQAKLLSALSLSFQIQAMNEDKTDAQAADRDEWLGALQAQTKEQLAQDYKPGLERATGLGERGVLRALLWGQKVSMIQNSLVGRFFRQGEKLFEGDKQMYVCEACGFAILKEGTAPDICPICKAPSHRFAAV